MRFVRRLFQGRLNRRNYLLGLTIAIILLCLVMPNDKIVNNDPWSTIGLLTLILFLIDALFLCSITVRRMHDSGKSWWHGIGSIEWYVFKNGEKEINKYGKPPDPKINLKTLFLGA